MSKRKKPSAEFVHGGNRIKCIALLLKCIFASVGYGLVWSGVVFIDKSFGIPAVICGAVITFLSVILFIIDPLSHRGRKK